MKNLHLSDALYLEDFDRILTSIFNQTPLNEQPKFIVEIDCGDGYLLKHAFDFIKSKTLRGSHLSDYPLEVVPIATSAVESIRRKLVDVPHRLTTDSLQSLDIDPDDCLFIEAFTDFVGIKSRHGLIHLQVHHQLSDEFLLNAAKEGRFPKEGASYSYSNYTLTHFEYRPYIIRHAIVADLKQLQEIEEACWKELAQPEDILTKRIQRPQLVVESKGNLVGVVYTQRISDIEDVYKVNCENVDTLVNPNGSIVQMLALNIHPKMQKSGLGGQLLEFVIQLASLNPQITQVIGVTRSLAYHGQEKLKDDPIIRMHLQHGAELRGVVPNYRPKDIRNQGYGALMVYPVKDRIVTIEKRTPLKHPEWIYEFSWIESPPPESQALPLDGLWIIFADEGEVIAHKMRELLKNHRQYCVIVQAGDTFEKHTTESFVMNPQSDFNQLFSSIPNISQLAGVIYMWGYLPKDLAKPDIKWIESWHKRSCGGLINLSNALDSLEIPLKLCVLAQSIVTDGNLESLAQWPMSRLVTVISHEYTHIKAFYLALGAQETVQKIYDEIIAKEPNSHIAWREGKRLIPKMVRGDLDKGKKILIDPAAKYLVAGGLSPVGMSIVSWYVSQGATNIIIIDENEPSPQLFEIPANIKVYKQLEESHLKGVKGIVHAELVLEDELLRHLTWDSIKLSYELRIKGSWFIHQHSEKLDHFILFSSIVTEFVPTGKASQAIATSFLDALAYYRQKQHLPCLAIDWGLWEIKQVVLKHVIETKQLKEQFKPFTKEEVFQILDEVISTTQPQIIVANFK